VDQGLPVYQNVVKNPQKYG